MENTLTLSPTIENYLEVILNISIQNGIVRITDLANHLNIAKSSVNQAVKSMVEMNLLQHEKYGPVELTKKGKEFAGKIKKKHQVIKTFLVEVLGVSPEVAEKDACAIEHVISPLTVEKIVEYSNVKALDINNDKKMTEVSDMATQKIKALRDLSPGMRGKIVRLTLKGDLRRRVMDMGLVSGTEITVEGVAPLGDPIEVKVRGYKLTLRKNEASEIFVEVI
ncbi:MAG: metal-dependent transcriptional regulator [Halanaerobiales bacterium]|nr:metal-dependent transcriptional regulator [Halanaerobiales bacterium]